VEAAAGRAAEAVAAAGVETGAVAEPAGIVSGSGSGSGRLHHGPLTAAATATSESGANPDDGGQRPRAELAAAPGGAGGRHGRFHLS
jgi:hypothetical protein